MRRGGTATHMHRHAGRRNEGGWALLYMLPAMLVLALFVYFPFARAIGLSLFIVDRNTFTPAVFHGLEYYGRVLNIGPGALGDDYLRSLLTSLTFAALVVPAGMAAALGLALLSASSLRGIHAFRTVYMTSVAISVASSSVIWALIYSPNARLFGWLLDLFRLKGTGVLTDSATALPAVAFMSVWAGLGFSYLVALAGIQSVPRDLYESASIDGVTGWRAALHITFPLMGGTLLFLFIVSTISCLQAFTQFKVLIDSAGPNRATDVFVYEIFDVFWVENNYGFASAMSVVLFFMTILLSWLQLRLDRRVHYQ